MKNTLTLLFFIILNPINFVSAQVEMNHTFETPYGKNDEVGKYVTVNGVKLYYEEYGEGEPLLLIHGNDGSIKSMGNQIDYFKSKYRVIVADSRGHGKSEFNTDSLTYNLMATDLDALVDHLKLKSINVVGWSDGGIIGLIMGIEQRSDINKIVVMGANLRPGSTAVHSWAPNSMKVLETQALEMIKKEDTTEDWKKELQTINLLLYQPNISHEDLQKIEASVLVIAGDRDVVKNKHTVEIFENIPSAHLSIMPGATHFAPASNPELFNGIVNKFLSENFTRPDSDYTKW